jgi:hypothetical protein
VAFPEIPPAAAAAASAASAAATEVDGHEEASGRLVLLRQPQIDEVTLAKWLKLPVLDDDEPEEAWTVTEAEGPELPWEECSEAIMDHHLELSNSIIQKIGNELKDLARWMMQWDLMFVNKEEERIRDRGRQGQCRQSHHTNVCHGWDPLDPRSKPRFKDEGRRVAARFYGAILDWAASKGKGLEFWKHSDSTRPTIILRAIRAIWGKERCQMDMLYDYEKNLETTYYIPVTLLTCMQERFPVLMWAEIFRTSPHFAYCHGPKKVFLAIDLCLQGDPSPWKKRTDCI